MKKSLLIVVSSILLINAFLLVLIFTEYKKQDKALKNTNKIITLSNKIIIELQNVENAQRGFLLTKEDVYFDNYTKHQIESNHLIKKLFTIIGDDIGSYHYLKKFKIYKRIAFNKLNSEVQLSKNNQLQYAINSMIQDYGMEYMQKARINLNKFISMKENNLTKQKDNFDNFIFYIYLFIILGAFIGFVLIIIFYNQSNKILEYQNKLQGYVNLLNKYVLFTRTDLDGRIVDVSDAFCNLSGYKKYEILGQNHRIFKSKETPNETYSNLWNSIVKEGSWYGEIRNRKKNGDLYWIYTDIASEYDEDGKKIGYISFKQDITDKKERDLQEIHIMDSSKMVALGEMIGNIAHQWRQPLSVISTSATGLAMQKEFGTLDDETLYRYCDDINKNAQYLSQTIDDFKNFIKGDRNKKIFNVQNMLNAFLNLISGPIKTNNIKVVLDCDKDINIESYENELIQCLINMFNNAKDALIEKEEKNKLIIISSYTKNNKVYINLKDNAKGIPDAIISKVFDPYFTTKHQSQGTGLGLNMTYRLITEGMNGDLIVKNEEFIYNDTTYFGASFTIALPYI